MKKKYKKPEVCCMDSKTGMILSTSKAFAERAGEMKQIFENGKDIKEEFISGSEAANKS